MTHSIYKYVQNSSENIDKLVRKVMEDMDYDLLWESAQRGLTNHYIDNSDCFIEDYYETFPEEDPDIDGVQEDDTNKVVYYHGHHSNPCVVGEIYTSLSNEKGVEVIAITHNMVYPLYGDNLCDITKVWDANVQIESTGRDRYDTDYDSCIHIPLDRGENTTLATQVLKQILINNKVEIVMLNNKDQFDLEKFCKDFLS